MSGDLLLTGGRVRTLDTAGIVAEAVLVEDGRIAAVGTSRDLTGRARPGTQALDLAGRTVIPGLIDAHAHLELSALAGQRWVQVRAASPEAAAARVAEAAAEPGTGEWIVAQGTFGQHLPSREQLDAAAPGRPVIVRESMHRLSASSEALARAGIDRRFVEPAGTRVRRTAAGEPTGIVEEGFDLFPLPWPDAGWLADALPGQARDSFVRFGVTAIHELPASQAALDAWRTLAGSDRMPCRIVLNPILRPGHQATVGGPGELLELRAGLGSVHPWLTVGALKLFLDGAGCAGLHHAQLSGPARGWGLQNFLYGELVRILAECRDARVHVWMHAVGDAAHTLAIDAVEEVNLACGNGDHRTRIEHIPRATADFSVFERLRRAGIVPVPTAAFMHFEPNMLGSLVCDRTLCTVLRFS